LRGILRGNYGKRANGNIVQTNLLKREDVEALGFVKIVEINGPTRSSLGPCSGKNRTGNRL